MSINFTPKKSIVKSTPKKIDFKPTPPTSSKIKSGMSGLGQLYGESLALNSKDYQGYQSSNQALGDLNLKLLQAIRKNKTEGKDTSRLEQQFKINTGHDISIEEIASSVKKTNKQVIGDVLQTAGYLFMPLGGGSVVGRLAIGASQGAIAGAGNAMSEDKTSQEVLSDTLKGASIGLVVSGAFEALGYGLRQFAKTRAIQNKTSNTYLKELQPKMSEVSSDFEKTPAGQAFKSIGTEIRDAVDDTGKPLYVGTYQTIADKAKITLKQKGQRLLNVLGKYDDTVKINKNEVAGDIVSEMQDRMGRLSKSELKTIVNEVNRVTENEITPTQALEYKRLYDSKIPDSFWNDTADRTKAIAVQSRYILRDNLRKLINTKTGDSLVQELNNSMGLSMDVRRLSANQLANRAMMKVGGQGGISPWKFLYSKLIDDMIFNPALTTRFSQTLNSAGSNTGKTVLRKLTRSAIIQTTSK
jgi:hypothetical protein